VSSAALLGNSKDTTLDKITPQTTKKLRPNPLRKVSNCALALGAQLRRRTKLYYLALSQILSLLTGIAELIEDPDCRKRLALLRGPKHDQVFHAP
jgi:hypothetical protein